MTEWWLSDHTRTNLISADIPRALTGKRERRKGRRRGRKHRDEEEKREKETEEEEEEEKKKETTKIRMKKTGKEM